MQFKETDIKKIDFSPGPRMADQWMLVTARHGDIVNTLTASWGASGHLWNKQVFFAFIRPQRYTFPLIDGSDTFTLSFLPEAYRSTLNYLGTVSGRDEDKIAGSGLTLNEDDAAFPYFEEAEMVVKLKKIYAADVGAGDFIDKSIVEGIYPEGDFHKLFIGEIVGCLTK